MKTMETNEEAKPLPEKGAKAQRKFAMGAIAALWLSLILAFVIIGLPKTKDEQAAQRAKLDSLPATANELNATTDNKNVQKDTGKLLQPTANENGSKDLVFYSKKEFLKYFINEYSEADLNKSLAFAKVENKSAAEEKEKKVILKVVQKKSVAEKKEFSSDFEIKAVPNK